MAKVEVNMPRFGASMKEGQILEWLVKVGDHVDEEQGLAQVQSEKMEAEVEALSPGTIVEIIAEVGETYKVGDVLAYMEEDA